MTCILIDLTVLKNVNCGLWQVALNYSYSFRDTYILSEYIVSFSQLIRIKFDVWYGMVWHAIHELFGYNPYSWHYILTIHDFNWMYEKQEKLRFKRLRRQTDQVRWLRHYSVILHSNMLVLPLACANAYKSNRLVPPMRGNVWHITQCRPVQWKAVSGCAHCKSLPLLPKSGRG